MAKPDFEQAQRAGLGLLRDIKDSQLKGAAVAIFSARPPSGPDHARELKNFCEDSGITPMMFREKIYKDARARKIFTDATNAAYKVLGIREISDDEMVFRIDQIVNLALSDFSL